MLQEALFDYVKYETENAKEGTSGMILDDMLEEGYRHPDNVKDVAESISLGILAPDSTSGKFSAKEKRQLRNAYSCPKSKYPFQYAEEAYGNGFKRMEREDIQMSENGLFPSSHSAETYSNPQYYYYYSYHDPIIVSGELTDSISSASPPAGTHCNSPTPSSYPSHYSPVTNRHCRPYWYSDCDTYPDTPDLPPSYHKVLRDSRVMLPSILKEGYYDESELASYSQMDQQGDLDMVDIDEDGEEIHLCHSQHQGLYGAHEYDEAFQLHPIYFQGLPSLHPYSRAPCLKFHRLDTLSPMEDQLEVTSTTNSDMIETSTPLSCFKHVQDLPRESMNPSDLVLNPNPPTTPSSISSPPPIPDFQRIHQSHTPIPSSSENTLSEIATISTTVPTFHDDRILTSPTSLDSMGSHTPRNKSESDTRVLPTTIHPTIVETEVVDGKKRKRRHRKIKTNPSLEKTNAVHEVPTLVSNINKAQENLTEEVLTFSGNHSSPSLAIHPSTVTTGKSQVSSSKKEKRSTTKKRKMKPLYVVSKQLPILPAPLNATDLLRWSEMRVLPEDLSASTHSSSGVIMDSLSLEDAHLPSCSLPSPLLNKPKRPQKENPLSVTAPENVTPQNGESEENLSPITTSKLWSPSNISTASPSCSKLKSKETPSQSLIPTLLSFTTVIIPNPHTYKLFDTPQHPASQNEDTHPPKSLTNLVKRLQEMLHLRKQKGTFSTQTILIPRWMGEHDVEKCKDSHIPEALPVEREGATPNHGMNHEILKKERKESPPKPMASPPPSPESPQHLRDAPEISIPLFSSLTEVQHSISSPSCSEATLKQRSPSAYPYADLHITPFPNLPLGIEKRSERLQEKCPRCEWYIHEREEKRRTRQMIIEQMQQETVFGKEKLQ